MTCGVSASTDIERKHANLVSLSCQTDGLREMFVASHSRGSEVKPSADCCKQILVVIS